MQLSAEVLEGLSHSVDYHCKIFRSGWLSSLLGSCSAANPYQPWTCRQMFWDHLKTMMYEDAVVQLQAEEVCAEQCSETGLLTISSVSVETCPFSGDASRHITV